MFYFIKYDKQTGEIKSQGGCSSQRDIQIQGNATMDVVEGSVKKKEYYRIKGKKIVRKSDTDIIEIDKLERKEKKRREESQKEIMRDRVTLTRSEYNSLITRLDDLEKK